MKNKIDATDWIILRNLQNDGRMTNVDLAEKADISPPSCLRRLRQLEDDKFIKGYRALLDEKKMGFDVTYFILVKLVNQSEDLFQIFRKKILEHMNIRQAWMLSGDTDCILFGVAKDMNDFQRVVSDMISWSEIGQLRSMISFKEFKGAPIVPEELEFDK